MVHFLIRKWYTFKLVYTFLQSKEKRVHKVQYLQDKNTLVYLG